MAYAEHSRDPKVAKSTSQQVASVFAGHGLRVIPEGDLDRTSGRMKTPNGWRDSLVRRFGCSISM